MEIDLTWETNRVLADPYLRAQFWARLKHFRITENNHPRLLLCCIGKNENRYAREYVQWYKDLGFSKIVIYDNNDVDGERFESVLADYIESGLVEIFDLRGKKRVQIPVYEECYSNFGSQYDWLAFFDMDEFLEIDCYDNAVEYFGSGLFSHFDMVHINWHCYADNDQLYYDDRPLKERFPDPLPLETDMNIHIKTVVRGGFGKLKWSETLHTPAPNVLRCANSIGHKCDSESPFARTEVSAVRLRHHVIKSTEEYRDRILRSFPDRFNSLEDIRDSVSFYFRYCTRTPDKENILTF